MVFLRMARMAITNVARRRMAVFSVIA
jgi:hypothetical protein